MVWADKLTVTSTGDGGTVITSGKSPFAATVCIRPVGTLELGPETKELLGGLFSHEYVPDLIRVLRRAHRIVEDGRNDPPT